jgi:class 3 adenylate cyclase
VTVLFADVVGSTSSVAGLDPEDARELMEPAVMQLAEIIRGHGGTISTIMGDGLMALFGAPSRRRITPFGLVPPPSQCSTPRRDASG